MVTVLNNPTAPATERTTIERTTSDSAGWAVAVIILLAVIVVGGYFFVRHYRAAAPAAPASSTGGANINVTLPSSDNSTPGNATPGATPSNSGAAQ